MPYTYNGQPISDAQAQLMFPSIAGSPAPGAASAARTIPAFAAGPGGGAYATSYGGTSTGTGGAGSPYGTRPAPVPTPPSQYQQAISSVPGLGDLGTAATGVVSSELAGHLSPETIAAIENATAAEGVTSGMPGVAPGTLTGNQGARNLGLATEQIQTQGLAGYENLLGSVGRLQLDPSLAASLGEYNTQIAAAPDPAQAAAEMERLWQKHFLETLGYTTPNPAGGTGVYRPSPLSNPLFPPGPTSTTTTPVSSTPGFADPYGPSGWSYATNPGQGLAPVVDPYTSSGQYFSPSDLGLEDYWSGALGDPTAGFGTGFGDFSGGGDMGPP